MRCLFFGLRMHFDPLAVEIREKTYGPVADDLEYAFELWTMGEKLSDRVIAEFDRAPRFSVWNAYVSRLGIFRTSSS